MTYKISTTLILSFVISTLFSLQAIALPQMVSSDEMMLSGRLHDGRPFTVRIGHSQSTARKEEPVKSVISDFITMLEVSVAGERFFLPAKAFSKLRKVSLPGGMFILQQDDELLLVITGGDGGEGYRAVLVFKNKRLVRRDLYKPMVEDFDKATPTSIEVY